MIVLACEKCNKICNAIHFQRNFKNWTSGNNDIDKYIQLGLGQSPITQDSYSRKNKRLIRLLIILINVIITD